MTRDDLAVILHDLDQCNIAKTEAADQILAELAKEQVVLGEAKITNFKKALWCYPAPFSRIARPMMEIHEYREADGKRGKLVFIPEGE
ncbi:MAG: hypothetical protein M0R06_03950 [Sphaerochaeta sp.]|jgi:hypothetical protein|nr:hypothetical protein [Sphaerochaeta sp.]